MTENAQQPGSGQEPRTEALTPQAAQAQIASHQQDRAYMDAYLAGERGKVDEMTRLFEAAYPEPGDDTAPPSDSVPTDDWLARPAAAHDYQIPLEVDNPEHRALQGEIKEALFAEDVPAFAVEAAVQVIERRMKDGLPNDETIERSKLEGMAELELRHGTAAKDILAAAQKMFERIDKRDPRIGDLLCASGAANDPYLIETAARLWGAKYATKAK